MTDDKVKTMQHKTLTSLLALAWLIRFNSPLEYKWINTDEELIRL